MYRRLQERVGHGGGVAAGICAVKDINVQDVDEIEIKKRT